MQLNRIIRWRIFGAAILLFVAGYFAIPLPQPLFPEDYSTLVLGDSTGAPEPQRVLRVFLNHREQWHLPPRPSLRVPDKLKLAVLFYEDRYFHYHPGVNPIALVRAAYQNLRSGKRISGASTLTMQVARLLRPKRRSYGNKLLEILQAFKIELRFAKADILKLYLDHAPYGGNVVGYQAASLRYFGKSPAALTWAESAALAVLPNAPGLISPEMSPGRLRNKRNRLLKRMHAQGIIPASEYRLALLEPTPAGSQPFQLLAPHLSQALRQRYGDSGGVIVTTIDPLLQRSAELIVRQHSAFLSHRGIANAALLIAETQSGKVRAYVGSQAFFDSLGMGQVDGVRAPRSSGSLLKPFLYALAMDEGILLPRTLLTDVPTFYGAFSPRNADERFAGVVQARQALIRSLNVPAVRLLYTYGVYPFYTFLKNAGISTLFRTAEDYGLPLIIGGAEVTLWDMATLFRGLGRGGVFQPLTVLQNGADAGLPLSRARISPGASYMTLEMLRDVKRPGAEYFWELFRHRYPVAWKTGTSYGQRDSWAVGVTPQWTIAVWVGNFSGAGNANLSGAQCAGPLLFEMVNILPRDPRLAWFESPESALSDIDLCRESGFQAGQHCPNPERVPAPRYAKPLRLCPYHHTIEMSSVTQHQVCSLCWTPGEHAARQRLIFPPEVVQYLRSRGQLIGDAPLHTPDCPERQGFSPVEIVYPQQNARLWVPRDFGDKLQKITARVAHRDRERRVFWYLNDRFLGTTVDRHEMALDCQKGQNILEILDDIGYRKRVQFFVQKTSSSE